MTVDRFTAGNGAIAFLVFWGFAALVILISAGRILWVCLRSLWRRL